MFVVQGIPLVLGSLARVAVIGLMLSPSCVVGAQELSIDPVNQRRRSALEGVAMPALDPAELVQELEQLQQDISRRARPVSMEEAVALSLQNNPQLTAAFSTIQQLEWQLIAAQRQWYPTAQLSNGNPFVGYSWKSFVSNNYGGSGAGFNSLQSSSQSATTSRNAQFQTGMTLSWNFIAPTRQPNINAASESLRQQKYLFDVSARNLVLNTQQSYFSIQSSQELIDSFQQILAINKQQLQILEARESIGMVTILDVQQTKSQLFASLNELVLYTRNYMQQAAQLASELALPDEALAIPSESTRLYGRWFLDLQKTIQQASQNREEVLAFLAAAEASAWKSTAAIRSYLPVFSLQANGTFLGTNGYEGVPGSLDPSNSYARTRSWSAAAGIGFTWSIFDGGIQAANAQAFKAEARQQRSQAAATELQVTQQVRSSYAQMQTARIGVKSAQQAFESAQIAQEASRARFAVGVGDITSVVQTIQQLSISAIQLSQATLSYNTAIAELYRYSATWPADAETELDQRLQRMRRPTAAVQQGDLP